MAVPASCAAIGSRPARFSANASRAIHSRSSSTSGIRTAFSVLARPPCGMQREPDARAVAGRAVDANSAAVRFDDALGYGKPEADPRRVTVCPNAVKTLEQTSLLLGGDPWPLILHAN